MQFQHVAACNALHPVEARTARWLLHIQDRIDGNLIPLTQEALSQLLGVRRTTVTLVMCELRASGAIRSARRGLVEIDRPRLEKAACECYKIMRGKFDEIFPLDTTKLRIPAAPARKTPSDRDSVLAE
jgi:DNA-binding transcriptional MocR family regulator